MLAPPRPDLHQLAPLLLAIGLAGCSQPFSRDGGDCVDGDGDYYCSSVDCDDADASVNPGAYEIWYDGRDDDCDGNDDDFDRDGAGLDEDCDDRDPSRYPAATEIWYDGVDQDCAGDSDYDADGDGEPVATDCDDENALINHLATETWYDGVDQDCAGDSDYDADGDGVLYPEDCDDQDPLEIRTEGCDGKLEDADGDGYTAGLDCDDGDASIHPGAAEIWYDGVDQDCDGDNDYDADRDGVEAEGYGAGEADCDDTDPTVLPGAIETIADGLDSDCDGQDATATFESLAVSGSTGLIGPRVAEFDGGLIIGVLSDSRAGAGTPGALWHYLDPTSPWSGSLGTGGWAFSSGSQSFGGVYDAVGSGDFLLEGYVLLSTSSVDIQTAVTSASGGDIRAATLPLDSSVVSGFEDLDVTLDGTDVGLVVCERSSSYEWVIYLHGGISDFYSNVGAILWGYNTTPSGGSQCAARTSDQLIQVIDGSTLQEYRLNTTTGRLNDQGSYATGLADLEWEFSGSSRAFAGAGTPVEIEVGTTSLSATHPGSGTPSQIQIAFSGRDVYAAYVDTTGEAWLVYGTTTAGVSTVPLDTGLTTVDAVDLLITSGGALVVAARGGNSLAYMAVDR